MKQLLRILLVGAFFLLLIFPVAAQETESYWEGIDVVRLEGHNIAATRVEIHAVKQVDGDNRQSEVHLVADFGGNPLSQIRYSVDTTFVVPLDADWLEVSEDLGWGGLDAEVSVPVQVLSCTDVIGGNCTTTTETVAVAIHLSALADQSVTEINGEFQRRAVVSGTVSIGNRDFAYNGVGGYNFSDQYSSMD